MYVGEGWMMSMHSTLRPSLSQSPSIKMLAEK